MVKGDKVIDDDGNIGIIEDADDKHNIEVRYLPNDKTQVSGGFGLYCLVKSCKEYQRIKLYVPPKKVESE